MKLRIPVEQLCYGLPMEFASYMNYCRSLRFEDRPDYSHLRKMFKELLQKEGHDYDHAFDWVILNEKLVDQSVLALVDNGEGEGDSKQSSVNMPGEGDEKKGDDEDKSDLDGEKNSEEEEEAQLEKEKERMRKEEEEAKKREEEEQEKNDRASGSLLGPDS